MMDTHSFKSHFSCEFKIFWYNKWKNTFVFLLAGKNWVKETCNHQSHNFCVNEFIVDFPEFLHSAWSLSHSSVPECATFLSKYLSYIFFFLYLSSFLFSVPVSPDFVLKLVSLIIIIETKGISYIFKWQLKS